MNLPAHCPYSRRCGGSMGRQFSLAGEVDGFGENFGGFLGSVEAHGVFGRDEIEPPLCLSLKFERGFKLFLGDASLFGGGDRVQLTHKSLAGTLQQLKVTILNHIHARLDFFL